MIWRSIYIHKLGLVCKVKGCINQLAIMKFWNKMFIGFRNLIWILLVSYFNKIMLMYIQQSCFKIGSQGNVSLFYLG